MKKTFDAVGFQRKAREEISKQYNSDPKAFLDKLKKQFGRLRKQKGAHGNMS